MLDAHAPPHWPNTLANRPKYYPTPHGMGPAAEGKGRGAGDLLAQQLQVLRGGVPHVDVQLHPLELVHFAPVHREGAGDLRGQKRVSKRSFVPLPLVHGVLGVPHRVLWVLYRVPGVSKRSLTPLPQCTGVDGGHA